MNVTAADIAQAQFEIARRNDECIAIAARQLFAKTPNKPWREQVDAHAPEVQKLVHEALLTRDYLVAALPLPEGQPEKIQDIYILQKWLDKNPAKSQIKQVMSKRAEFEALVDLNCYQLTNRLGIENDDPRMRDQLMYQSGLNIQRPSQNQRYH